MERYWQDLFEGERALRQALEKQLAELRRAIEELALEFAPELSIVYPEDVKRLGERIREKIESAQEPWRSKYLALQKELKSPPPSSPAPPVAVIQETHPRPEAGIDLKEIREIASTFKLLPPFSLKNWEKPYLLLAVIGLLGFSGRPRLAAIVGKICDISPNSGSIQRAIKRLIKYRLVKAEKVEGSPFSLLMLTEKGKEFFKQISGRTPVLTEAELLLKTHPGDIAHTAFCVWARELAEAAGYRVIIPEQGRIAWEPDLIFEDNGFAFGVEVERALGEGEKRQKKWRMAKEVQGFAAVITPDENVRMVIRGEIMRAGVRAKLTDFSYLLQRQAVSKENFWIEEVEVEE